MTWKSFTHYCTFSLVEQTHLNDVLVKIQEFSLKTMQKKKKKKNVVCIKMSKRFRAKSKYSYVWITNSWIPWVSLKPIVFWPDDNNWNQHAHFIIIHCVMTMSTHQGNHQVSDLPSYHVFNVCYTNRMPCNMNESRFDLMFAEGAGVVCCLT